MSRDGSGVYHRPVGTDAITDTTIESTKYNINVADVEQDLNLPRPIVAGGTAATSADGALDSLSAEKFKQIVTNWDSTIWRAGSFYAASTAAGTAPIAGRGFAGIAYYANASDFVLQATDITDIDSPIQYVRTQSAGVWGPWIVVGGGPAIAAGSVLIGDYYFNATTTFPPGSGQVRFNSATQSALTTELFFSHLTATNIDITAALPLNVFNGSEITIRDKDEPAKYKVFTATAAPVLSGGDFRITVAFKSGGTDLTTAQRVLTSTSGAAVRYDIAQNLTVAQQSQARQNTGVTKKNYVINGAMAISQENGSNAGTAVNYYPVDTFLLSYANSGTQTVQQVASLTPSGSLYRLRLTATVADAAVATGDYCLLSTRIEGLRMSDLGFGTPPAKQMTLQFGVRAPAGTYCVAFRNGDVTRSYVAEYVIAAGEANTNVVRSITILGDVTGTWAADNGRGLDISWMLMAGATFQIGTPNVWSGANLIATANQYNFMGTAGNVFELFDVGLYEGTVAPPFMVPDYASELMACQRYVKVLQTAGISLPVTGFTNNIIMAIPIPVMRATPTMNLPWVDVNFVTSGPPTVANQWSLVLQNVVYVGRVSGNFSVTIPTNVPGLIAVNMSGMTLNNQSTCLASGPTMQPLVIAARL